MDPIFFSQVNGVPQESKLATYMQNRTTPTLINNLSSLTLEETLISVKKVTPQAPEFVPGGKSGSPNFMNTYPGLVNAVPVVFNRRSSEDNSLPITPRLTPQPSPPLGNSSPSLNKAPIAPVATYQENVGGTTYFYPTTASEAPTPEMGAAAVVSPSNYHMYPGTPSHLSNVTNSGKPSPASGFYVSEDIRLETMHRNALILAQPDPEQNPDLPAEIDTYHELCPLKPIDASTSARIEDQLFGHPMTTYKATNLKNGIKFCLRRIHGFRLPNSRCMTVVDMWKRVQHSNIVQLKEVFTTKAFNDNSIIFVYDYHPGSETLYSKHFSSSEPINGYTDPFSSDPAAPRPYSHQKNTLLRQQHSNMLPENVIWNYIVQLTSAIRVIHTAGLACRTLDPTKIILTSPTRLRLSCLGIADVITFDAASASPLQLIPHYQQEDLTALGKVILALSCKSLMAVQHDNIQTSIDLIARTYSTDLRNFVTYLLTNQPHHPPTKSVTDLMPMIGARFYTHLDQLQLRGDMLENELAKEMENGRLTRLMAKLATINERPEHNLDPSWAETGDRYMLKLFRDYVFHQVTEDGRPWLDMAHVVQCLNKLDVGSPEKVSLMSRDEQSILVVSYSELKHCLEQSFEELLAVSKMDGML